MSTQTTSVQDDYTVTTTTSAPASQDNGKDTISMVQLANMLGQVQLQFGVLESTIANSQIITDSEGNQTTISQRLTGETVDAMNKKVQDQLDAIHKAEEAAKHRSLFSKIFGGAAIAVALITIPLTGGLSAPVAVGAAMGIIAGSMALAGKEDPIQMATDKLAEHMPKLAADFLMATIIAVSVAGGNYAVCSMASGAAEGAADAAVEQGAAQGVQQGATSAGKTAAWTALEQFSQMLLQTGAIADTTAKISNDNAALAVEILLTITCFAVCAYAGAKMCTQSSSDNLITMACKGSEKFNPTTISLGMQRMQTMAQLTEVGAGIGTGVYTIKAANAANDATDDGAATAELASQLKMINNSGDMLSNTTNSILSEIADAINSITKASGLENEALASA